jgi:exodeoxyribonuclease VII small subunit
VTTDPASPDPSPSGKSPSRAAGKTTGQSSRPRDAREAPLSYEQAREELVQVVQKLEAGGTTLEESLTLWERGEELAAICQQWLDGARQRLAKSDPASE